MKIIVGLIVHYLDMKNRNISDEKKEEVIILFKCAENNSNIAIANKTGLKDYQVSSIINTYLEEIKNKVNSK